MENTIYLYHYFERLKYVPGEYHTIELPEIDRVNNTLYFTLNDMLYYNADYLCCDIELIDTNVVNCYGSRILLNSPNNNPILKLHSTTKSIKFKVVRRAKPGETLNPISDSKVYGIVIKLIIIPKTINTIRPPPRSNSMVVNSLSHPLL